MQSISFGKIYKVNVPADVAGIVVDTARWHRNNFKNSKLLGNPDKAHVVSPNNQDVYIFTGKDGENYWKSYCQAFEHMDWAHNYYKSDDFFFDIETDSAWEEHANWTRNYLNDNRSKIKKLNVKYRNCDYPEHIIIKSINITA